MRHSPDTFRWLAHSSVAMTGHALLALSLMCAGCTSSQTETAAAKNGEKQSSTAAYATPPKDAREAFKRMVAAYQKAKSYRDAGHLQFRMTQGETKVDEKPAFSVKFIRPNKLRLDVYQSVVACDGKRLRAVIEDNIYQGDVLDRAAPKRLSLEEVFSDDILSLYLTQSGIVRGTSMQLLLLLADKPADLLLEGTKKLVLLKPSSLDGRKCFRVQATRDDGDSVFWIDQSTYALRRLEFPTDELKKYFEEQQGPVSRISLTAEFEDVQLNGDVAADNFELKLPTDATLVAQFDPRKLDPPPPAPSKLLGEQSPDFEFVTLDGQKVDRKSIAGKVAIFDFWATWCGPCRESLPELARVRKNYAGNDNVLFYAVSIDEQQTKNSVLQKALAEWNVDLPIVRATEANGPAKFATEGVPNLVVIGPDGTLQDNEAGFDPQLASALPGRIEKLLAGGSLVEETRQRHQHRLAEYEQRMSQPQREAVTPADVEVKIADKTEPQHLKLTSLWTNNEINQPGNILVVEQEAGSPAILVNDGWRAVAELGADGKTIAQHELQIPDQAVVGYLRTTMAADGRRLFLGLASSRDQVILFDAHWKQLWSYPQAGEVAIADARFANLDGEGDPELYVSCWDKAGVHRVGLDGKPAWRCRQLENVYRLTAVGQGSQGHLLAVDGRRGSLISIDVTGKQGPEIVVANRYLRWIEAADLDGDGQPELCGLAPAMGGSEAVVGLDAKGNELWSHPLPPGAHQAPLEMLTWGRLLPGESSQWLAAAADGSLHVLCANGELAEQFNYGQAITGLACTRIGERSVLLVATAKGIEAWQVDE